MADFISFFLNIPLRLNNLVSLRPNYFIFMEYLKTGGGGGRLGFEPPSGSATTMASNGSVFNGFYIGRKLMFDPC